MIDLDIYCPVCAKTISPSNIDDIMENPSIGAVYVHDDIHHSDDDLDALYLGIQ